MSNPIDSCIWLDGQAAAAADFYVSTFPDARILSGSDLVVKVRVGEVELMQGESLDLVLL